MKWQEEENKKLTFLAIQRSFSSWPLRILHISTGATPGSPTKY